MSICRAGQSHELASKLVLYLMAHNGHVEKPNWEVEKEAGLTPGQLDRARAHILEAETTSGDPCLGYRLNYRWSSNRGSDLSLLDENDTFNRLTDWTESVMRGVRQRFVQQVTEQRRMATQYGIVAAAWIKTCRRCRGSNCRLGRGFNAAADEWLRYGHVTTATDARIRAQAVAHAVTV